MHAALPWHRSCLLPAPADGRLSEDAQGQLLFTTNKKQVFQCEWLIDNEGQHEMQDAAKIRTEQGEGQAEEDEEEQVATIKRSKIGRPAKAKLRQEPEAQLAEAEAQVRWAHIEG